MLPTDIAALCLQHLVQLLFWRRAVMPSHDVVKVLSSAKTSFRSCQDAFDICTIDSQQATHTLGYTVTEHWHVNLNMLVCAQLTLTNYATTENKCSKQGD